MSRNAQHDMLTTPSAGVRARQRFVLQLKKKTEHFRGRLVSAMDAKFETDTASNLAPMDQAAGELYAEESYQTVCALKRFGQGMMWSAIDGSIRPELGRLSTAFREATSAQTVRGSLDLSAGAEIAPAGWVDARVHLQPGGYLLDEGPDDVLAGAYYEEGGALYSRGQGVGAREGKADCIIRFLKGWKPDFAPKRILDIGCSAGASSTPYAKAFPDAEVHAIDIGAGLLRYAHARAESLELPVHFHRMNAEDIQFEDASFDLVVSHNAMHEMAASTQQRLFDETYRLLSNNGICVHQDLPLKFGQMSPVKQANLMFDEWFNGELFWSDYTNFDCERALLNAGFSPEFIQCEQFPLLDGTMSWYLAAAEKHEDGTGAADE